MKRTAAISVLAAATIATAMTASLSAPAASADTALATLVGTTDLPGGVAYLEVEQPTAFDSDGQPTQYTDTVVDKQSTNGGGQFTVTLPNTTTVTGAAVNGWVNTLTVVKNGNQSTANYQPVLIDRSNTSAGSTQDLNSPTTVDEGTLAAAQTTSTTSTTSATPNDLTVCTWMRVNRSEQSTRVGEVHVANVSGMSGTFTWYTQDDSSFTVGMSTDGTNWGVDGTFTLSASIGSNAELTDSAGQLDYVDDDMYYGKFENNGAASCPGVRYKTHVIGSVGDVFRGTNTPGNLPYSSCHNDPYGLAVVAYKGSWAQDQSTAVSYGVVASAFNFSFGGHTGYTSGIRVHLHNNNASANTYACGTNYVPNMPIVYSRGN